MGKPNLYRLYADLGNNLVLLPPRFRFTTALAKQGVKAPWSFEVILQQDDPKNLAYLTSLLNAIPLAEVQDFSSSSYESDDEEKKQINLLEWLLVQLLPTRGAGFLAWLNEHEEALKKYQGKDSIIYFVKAMFGSQPANERWCFLDKAIELSNDLPGKAYYYKGHLTNLLNVASIFLKLQYVTGSNEDFQDLHHTLNSISSRVWKQFATWLICVEGSAYQTNGCNYSKEVFFALVEKYVNKLPSRVASIIFFKSVLVGNYNHTLPPTVPYWMLQTPLVLKDYLCGVADDNVPSAIERHVTSRFSDLMEGIEAMTDWVALSHHLIKHLLETPVLLEILDKLGGRLVGESTSEKTSMAVSLSLLSSIKSAYPKVWSLLALKLMSTLPASSKEVMGSFSNELNEQEVKALLTLSEQSKNKAESVGDLPTIMISEQDIDRLSTSQPRTNKP